MYNLLHLNYTFYLRFNHVLEESRAIVLRMRVNTFLFITLNFLSFKKKYVNIVLVAIYSIKNYPFFCSYLHQFKDDA